MIKFACNCGERFEVPESEAGDSFQCPVCHRLVDVPLLSELSALDEDGTLKLSEPEPLPSDLGGKMQAFGRRDDMRLELDDFLKIGVDPSEGVPGRNAPRYDPETGELVVPIEMREDPARDHPADIPMAVPVLGYARSGGNTPEGKTTLTWWQTPFRLLSVMSLMAMFFVFITHVIVHGIFLVPALNILAIPPAIGIVIFSVAHYCNTIEDFGTREMDDVPVYLRNISLSEDIATPFYHFIVTSVYALLPAICALAFGLKPFLIEHPWVFLLLIGWAGLVFPAMLFTSLCSGAMQNLLPRHVFSVIIVAPAQYALATSAFWLGCVAYLFAFSQMHFAPVSTLQNGGSTLALGPILTQMGICDAAFAVAIYFMHLASAWLGLIYRSHHLKFNWTLQRHNSGHRTDTASKLLKLHLSKQPTAQKMAETQGRIDYLRQAERERRAMPVEPLEPLPPKTPRGFEV